ncbi:MAG: hypothetical protein ACI81L_001790 [Verrucomicrobiales bacterium]|jgi:hypothetical protein
MTTQRNNNAKWGQTQNHEMGSDPVLIDSFVDAIRSLKEGPIQVGRVRRWTSNFTWTPFDRGAG